MYSKMLYTSILSCLQMGRGRAEVDSTLAKTRKLDLNVKQTAQLSVMKSAYNLSFATTKSRTIVYFGPGQKLMMVLRGGSGVGKEPRDSINTHQLLDKRSVELSVLVNYLKFIK